MAGAILMGVVLTSVYLLPIVISSSGQQGPESLTCGFVVRSVKARARVFAGVLTSEPAFWFGNFEHPNLLAIFIGVSGGDTMAGTRSGRRPAILLDQPFPACTRSAIAGCNLA
jgi:hypothetical protein